MHFHIQGYVSAQRGQAIDARYRNPPFVPLLDFVWVHPFIVTIPNHASTLRFKIRTGLVGIAVLNF